VLVLSEEFITTFYPMEELHLLMERQRQGSQAALLPVFYDVTWEQVHASVLKLKAKPDGAPAQDLQPISAQELEDLAGITGMRPDQVGNGVAVTSTRVPLVMLSH
jgi:hypothetical protein